MNIICLLTIISSVYCSRCPLARNKCAYRMGCGMALHSYMVDCADLIAGRTNKCKVQCQRALIALYSTEEGQELVECDCEGSKFCQLNKERIQVCRPHVLQATAEGSIVSCSTARWICAADPLCNTALDFYHRFCRGLFHGRRCTPRCNNSLSILNRQEKASKLRSCYCDGTEEFPCQRIKDNTERLCLGNEIDNEITDDFDNEIDVIGHKSDSCRTNGSNIVILISSWMILRIFSKLINCTR